MVDQRFDPNAGDFQIVYDGPSLRDGEMDVRELAPALMAIADLCQEANTILNGSDSVVGVNIKATRRGSFLAHLVLDLEDLAGLFPVDVKAKEIIWTLFGSQGAFIGLVSLIKFLKGKPIQAKEILQDGSIIIDLTNANINAPVMIRPTVKRLYESESARKAAERIAKPLMDNPGIEVIELRKDDQVIESITGEHADAFEMPQSLVPVLISHEGTRIALLQIVTASFEDRYQWRFTDGSAPIMAPIEDDEFFQRINNGERFGKGDVLRVELHERQWQDEKGLHVEHRILHVLGVIPAPVQLPLR